MEEKKERLKALLDEYTKGNACLAFSGGIDSSLILKLLRKRQTATEQSFMR